MVVISKERETVPVDTSEHRPIRFVSCEMGDMLYPLFRSVEEEVERQVTAASPEGKEGKRVLQIFAKSLAMALVVIPHNLQEERMYGGSFGRTEVVDAIRVLAPLLDSDRIAPGAFDQLVLKVHKAVESSPFGQEDRI